MKLNIEIARSIELKKTKQVAESVGIPCEEVENYSRYIVKISERLIDKEKVKQSNLILITTTMATKAGISKTTVSIDLALRLNKIGKKVIVVLHESPFGPCFGVKGGAASGGHAQVLPMERISLYSTNDFHAITSTHNMISALLSDHIYQHQVDGFGPKGITWRRVLGVNGRSLRSIATGLRPHTSGVTMGSGFDITPASETMAILCLSKDTEDLHRRIENVIPDFDFEGRPFAVKDLGVADAITVSLKDTVHPNLVQTTEGTAAFVCSRPFADIAHDCNSILVTKMAMAFGDYVATEADFGADLRVKKFYNIKCRKSGLWPKLIVTVAAAQGLKMHGGASLDRIKEPNTEGLKEGLGNLDKHICSLRYFGQTVIVVFNRFVSGTDEEVETVRRHCEEELKVGFAINNASAEGGESAIDLTNFVVDTIEKKPSALLQYTYEETDTVQQEIEKAACNPYGASVMTYNNTSRRMTKLIEEMDTAHYPAYMTKAQYFFSANPKIYGTVNNLELHIKDIVTNSSAEMFVTIAGETPHMPGLPKVPQAEHTDIVDGNIEGPS